MGAGTGRHSEFGIYQFCRWHAGTRGRRAPRDQTPPNPMSASIIPDPSLPPSLSLSPAVLLLTHRCVEVLLRSTCMRYPDIVHSQRAGERERTGPGAVRVLQLAVTVRARSGTGALCACRAARWWWLVGALALAPGSTRAPPGLRPLTQQ